MGNIITQYSKIRHKTTITGATFTVPTQEDFTLAPGLSGSWTAYDLAKSEIGVDENTNQAFIRIGQQIQEFSFIGASGSGLPNTLLSNNTTGGTDIILSNNDKFRSPNGNAFVQPGDTNLTLYSSDESLLGAGTSSINIINVTNNGIKFLNFTSGASYSFPQVNGQAGQYLVNDGGGQLNWATASVGTTPSLSQVLGVGNDTLGEDIILGTGSTINSYDGTAQIAIFIN